MPCHPKWQTSYTKDIGNLIRTRRKYERIQWADFDNIDKWYAFDFNCKITHQAMQNAEINYFKIQDARNITGKKYSGLLISSLQSATSFLTGT